MEQLRNQFFAASKRWSQPSDINTSEEKSDRDAENISRLSKAKMLLENASSPLKLLERRSATAEEHLDDEEAIHYIREQWIQKKMTEREGEFTQVDEVRVLCCTWNVNGKKLTPTDALGLGGWLGAWAGGRGQPPGLVAVGLQEMVDLTAVNVASDAKSRERAARWEQDVQEALDRLAGPAAQYQLVARQHMVGVFLAVFAARRLAPRVRCARGAVAPVGVMGVLGNKGGVSVRLRVHDSWLCFVCAHLAAHRDNVEGRHQDFHNVRAKTLFLAAEERDAALDAMRMTNGMEGSPPPSGQPGALGGVSSEGGGEWLPVRIMDHDVVFWMGDLNYRIDMALPKEAVDEKVDAGDLAYLRDLDQLNQGRAAGRAFAGFEEAPLTFAPTYKYQPGTDAYDRRPEKKQRAPAWCDRVLWWAKDKSSITQLSYGRCAQLKMSDHKPVGAEFAAALRRVEPARRQLVRDEICAKLQSIGAFGGTGVTPEIKLGTPLPIDFGPVRYHGEVHQPLRLCNTGQVVAFFRFLPKLERPDHISKQWLTVTPWAGMLLPGETIDIDLKVYISTKVARTLSQSEGALEDLLVVQVCGGGGGGEEARRRRQRYVQVVGEYARSCYGASLLELVNCRAPVRSTPFGAEAGPAMAVPKELWRATGAVHAGGGAGAPCRRPDLFVAAGRQGEVAILQECLATGVVFPDHSVHSMCEVLVTFLASLETPVIPTASCLTYELEASNYQIWIRKFLDSLENHNYNTFIYLISFFRDLLKYSNENMLTAEILSMVCCSCLLGGGERSSSSTKKRNLYMSEVFKYLLKSNII